MGIAWKAQIFRPKALVRVTTSGAEQATVAYREQATMVAFQGSATTIICHLENQPGSQLEDGLERKGHLLTHS